MLKHFITDLHYLDHLKNLRSYFFLLDGEFGKSLTEGLFERLYTANVPLDLINSRRLQIIMDCSLRAQDLSHRLSFKINTVPKALDLNDPDIFDSISLTYRVGWPLNILLPSEAISKYDALFKFVLKLRRVAWVLKNIFQASVPPTVPIKKFTRGILGAEIAEQGGRRRAGAVEVGRLPALAPVSSRDDALRADAPDLRRGGGAGVELEDFRGRAGGDLRHRSAVLPAHGLS